MSVQFVCPLFITGFPLILISGSEWKTLYLVQSLIESLYHSFLDILCWHRVIRWSERSNLYSTCAVDYCS